ncbi:hypothetical protein GCM10025858_13220 [Alicyclobacillus sacchari]|nr:hypothetical protein GCM10025858_13220 [Alicyclobacillus sacchari]
MGENDGCYKGKGLAISNVYRDRLWDCAPGSLDGKRMGHGGTRSLDKYSQRVST